MQTANHELCHYYLARPGKPHIKFEWGGGDGGETFRARRAGWRPWDPGSQQDTIRSRGGERQH